MKAADDAMCRTRSVSYSCTPDGMAAWPLASLMILFLSPGDVAGASHVGIVESDNFVTVKWDGVVQCGVSVPSSIVYVKKKSDCVRICMKNGTSCTSVNYRQTERSCGLFNCLPTHFIPLEGCVMMQRRSVPTSTPVCPGGEVYSISVNADDRQEGVYIDDVEYTKTLLVNWDDWNIADTIVLDFLPSVVAIWGRYLDGLFGIQMSDSAGFVTDGSWRCTMNYTAGWWLRSFDDSRWPAALVADINGDRTSTVNKNHNNWNPIPVISNRAQWIWTVEDPTGLKTYNAYCRFKLPLHGNSCFSSPCKNGGTCTNVLATYKCKCPTGFNGSQCTNPSANYSITVTVDDNLFDLYLDGVRYELVNWREHNIPDTVRTDFRPKVIAIYGNDDVNMYGVLASDSSGLVTGVGWKCTRLIPDPNWMLPTYNDSAWPTATILRRNGDNTAWNTNYNSGQPIAGISLDAYWIWTPDPVSPPLNYVYCRSPLLY